ncbi:hypothetical protein ACFVDQ_45310 [Streptomyces sp. NPDC057684]|uniref:hypothetical protein n=1 Tax=Streptomyces sp. NPDC057684 TaxID=3346211 RepID=UPI00367B0B60
MMQVFPNAGFSIAAALRLLPQILIGILIGTWTLLGLVWVQLCTLRGEIQPPWWCVVGAVEVWLLVVLGVAVWLLIMGGGEV